MSTWNYKEEPWLKLTSL